MQETGSIPRSERSPGEGNGNPLQYSCLENSMDREAWWATVKNGELMFYHFKSIYAHLASRHPWVELCDLSQVIRIMAQHRVAGVFISLGTWGRDFLLLACLPPLLFPTLRVALALQGFPGGSNGKKTRLQCRKPGFDPLEKGTATHSSRTAWRIPWTEELGRL